VPLARSARAVGSLTLMNTMSSPIDSLRSGLAVEHVSIDELHRDPGNPGRITDHRLDSLTGSMRSLDVVLSEGLIVHGLYPDVQARRRRVAELLELVGLGGVELQRHPHSFSGGQRIAIARALAIEPEILVLDEPVSSLDVSIQAQILNLFADLRSRLELTILLIAHDLAVVRYLRDRVAVMQAGTIIETADSSLLHSAPKHPYTEELLLATPVPDLELERQRRSARASGDPRPS
jgi:ABC-type oligopeptide transport system ATPase subunit